VSIRVSVDPIYTHVKIVVGGEEVRGIMRHKFRERLLSSLVKDLRLKQRALKDRRNVARRMGTIADELHLIL
jgi:hypothetical protein